MGEGSSPLTRGKPGVYAIDGEREGLIPAHAGKTSGIHPGLRSLAAHPRSRGENREDLCISEHANGSSPLTRGKLCGVVTLQLKARLIPAHAGKTSFPWPRSPRFAAHPRSRGENLP